jgi:Flp pilus assembly protein TadB
VTSLVVVLLGGGMGCGLFVVIRAFFKDRTVPLPALRAAVASTGVSASETEVSGTPRPDLGPAQIWLARIGGGLLGSGGLTDVDRLRNQLRVLDKSVERHSYEKMLGAVAGFCLPVAVGAVLVAGGVRPPVVLILLAGLGLGLAGFLYPDLPLNDRVEQRRQAFRHTLSSYLDLVTIMMAGGSGPRSALEGAADAGDGWAFAEIRAALRRAATARRSTWEVFEELGIELGIDELRELAASISLAGESGAKIKESLSAKADAMRAAQAAQIETDAERQTEKMIVPVVVLIVGLVLFIGYGAMEAITAEPNQAQPAPDIPAQLDAGPTGP